MRKLTFILVLISLQSIFALAQQQAYIGFRGEVSVIQPYTSMPTDVKNGIGYGGGLTFHYLFSDKWDMTTDALFSVLKLSGNAYSFDETSSDYKSIGAKAVNFKSFDFAYTVLRGFGNDQRFKVGLGFWYGMILKNTSSFQSDYWGNSTDLSKDYALDSLFGTNRNYGPAVEGVYNMNDALQFSLRYKYGLPNLYSGGSNAWHQSKFCLNVMYYFGAEQRGKIKSNGARPHKSKYKW